MDLRGLYKFTLVDYPGNIACIVFTGGCNLRCPYCHNAALVLDPKSQPRVTETEVFNFLNTRRGLLDGVVISGGEPTLQPDLKEFCAKIKAAGFKIKLDTNSTHPETVFDIHREVGLDAVGIDVKAPAARYNEITRGNLPDLAENVAKVVEFAVANKVAADVRTTVHKSLLSEDDLRTMYREITAAGAKEWILQQFNPVEVIADGLQNIETYSDHELVTLARKLGTNVRVRGLRGHILH